MQTLIDTLTKATSEFKSSYIHQVEIWAGKQVQQDSARANKYLQGRAMYSSIQEYYKEQKWYYNSYNQRHDVQYFVNRAEKQFADGVAKLAYRMGEKGISGKSFTIKSCAVHAGNLDLTIVDEQGNKVTAQTIVAYGPVQRPHYRYLVR